ncbi:TPA: hypothetical protein DIV49_00470 [Candidatus Saccharibacteria bacterium]|nr:hypothetical protein [Candidatus Saccharibacteria bacterium]HRJ90919.1 GNAT family N-acetyltransferase [Candidatus Saccharibacteria bacterium]
MIRLANDTDHAGVEALLALMHRKINDELFTQLLHDETRAILVDDQSGELSGMVLCNIVYKLDRKECRLDRLIVREEFRGQGIGTKLLRAAEEWAWKHDVKRIEFTSSAKRPEAHHLYTKNGYENRDTKVFAKTNGEIEAV